MISIIDYYVDRNPFGDDELFCVTSDGEIKAMGLHRKVNRTSNIPMGVIGPFPTIYLDCLKPNK